MMESDLDPALGSTCNEAFERKICYIIEYGSNQSLYCPRCRTLIDRTDHDCFMYPVLFSVASVMGFVMRKLNCSCRVKIGGVGFACESLAYHQLRVRLSKHAGGSRDDVHPTM